MVMCKWKWGWVGGERMDGRRGAGYCVAWQHDDRRKEGRPVGRREEKRRKREREEGERGGG